MISTKIKTIKLITFIFIHVFILNINGQNFTAKQLIDLAGKNTNFEVITHQYSDLAYICWENEYDSTYAIYLKKLRPQIQNEIIIDQDTCKLSNPTFTFLPNDDIQIVWQKYINNRWQLITTKLIQDSLTEVTAISDSLTNNTDPTISFEKLAWIRDSSLVLSSQNSGWNNFEILDTMHCSNPDLFASDDNLFHFAVYEKRDHNGISIKEVVEYAGNTSSRIVADSGIYKNPNYGWDLGLSYQKFENNVWKVMIPGYNGTGWQSTNLTFNKEHPNLFSFMILFKENSEDILNVFIAYDSDSLSNNKDIYIKLFPNWLSPNPNTINISNLPGEDIKPLATVIDDSVRIFWEHINSGNSSEIWWAKDLFNIPDPTIIKSRKPEKISLIKNYPNPFNNSTNIEFSLIEPELVNITIYNNLGEKIVELLNKFKNSGKHKMVWDGKNSFNQTVASGVYIYTITSDEFKLSKKLLYLK